MVGARKGSQVSLIGGWTLFLSLVKKRDRPVQAGLAGATAALISLWTSSPDGQRAVREQMRT